MSSLKTTILILLFCQALVQSAYSQEKKLFTASFENYSFPQLVDFVESQSSYHFYYDPQQVDTLKIHTEASHLTLGELLDLVLNNTGLYYAIDNHYRVFITNKRKVKTALPTGFFDPSKAPVELSDTGVFMTGAEHQEKYALKGTENNKIFEIGNKFSSSKTTKSYLAGYIRENKTGEPIPSANITIDGTAMSIVTDKFGYYSVFLTKGKHHLQISAAGMRIAVRQIILFSDGKLNVDLDQFTERLNAVIVSAEKNSNTKSVEMGMDKLSIRAIRQVPAILGETDVLKVLLTLPGVTSVGEASNGFNVRGGSTDQNLILFSDATIYNPSHLFGFFSAFSPDVVKNVELYKSAIPEKYGGRLSSVVDVSVRDGNTKNWSGSAGIGPLTSKISIEGPIKKDKTSLIIAFRTTYSDWLLHNIQNSAYNNSSANFYDINLHLSHIIDTKNSIYFTFYLSQDKFKLNSDTAYQYGNSNANVKWKHNFTNNSAVVFSAGIDHYQYAVNSEALPLSAFNLKFSINQSYFRGDFTYAPGNKHLISYGLNTIYYKLYPGAYLPEDEKSIVVPNIVPPEQALESAVYFGDQYLVNSNLSISAGIRYSMFNYLGPHDVYQYIPGIPKTVGSISDTLHYTNNQVIKTYSAPEIRISARYSLTDNSSVKISFNTTEQYIHMLSNTTSISPTDIWKLSDPNISPQHGAQLSLGYYKNFKSNTIETSVEIYYKSIYNYLDYKSGASLLLNNHIETDVFRTKGRAYGLEILVKKTTGKINGWISYTYSRTELKQDDPLAGQTINNGNYYPASFDKPQNIDFIGNYRFSHRLSLSLNVIYSTGRPITLPLAVFNLGGTSGLYYSERNQYRIPDYFRTDISFNLDGNHKVKQRFHNSWSFGVYNLTGRQNAYSVYFVQEGQQIKGYQLSIFGSPIPFVTFNVKF